MRGFKLFNFIYPQKSCCHKIIKQDGTHNRVISHLCHKQQVRLKYLVTVWTRLANFCEVEAFFSTGSTATKVVKYEKYQDPGQQL